MKIKIEAEVMPTMGGLVTFHTKLCPYGLPGILTGGTATVGSSSCKMCSYHGGEQKDDVGQDCVICNHD